MTISEEPLRSHAPGLPLLTDEDWASFLGQARHIRFSRDEVIVVEGAPGIGVGLIREGYVRVERASVGRGIAVARRGPGEVISEMSYLQRTGASASVVADGDVELAIVDAEDVDAALETTPGLALRFFRSLALVLSGRLEELTSALPSLLLEGPPLVSGVRAERSARIGHLDLPPALSACVDDFKTVMLEVDRELVKRKLTVDVAQSRVSQACDNLESALREHAERQSDLTGAIGTYVFRETFPFFMQSQIADRAYSKPRGYAGDYATIEILYEDIASGDGRLGPLIDRWTRELPAARAVKNRRSLLSDVIRQLAREWTARGPMPVTSLAAGPARELFDVMSAPDAPHIFATCVDIDRDALVYAAGLARERGLSDRFTFAQDNVVRLSQGRGHTALAPQALIYSIGLTDYLQDNFVVDLLDWAYERLLPGGTLIIGNVVPGNPSRAFMDHVLDWVLIHRSEEELRSLFGRSKFGSTNVSCQLEPAGVDLFASCRKPEP